MHTLDVKKQVELSAGGAACVMAGFGITGGLLTGNGILFISGLIAAYGCYKGG